MRWAYTRMLLATHGPEVRYRLMSDPCLFNARHYHDYAVMAIHYNTEVDRRAALSADDVRELMEL